jgi:hypothetical protein
MPTPRATNLAMQAGDEAEGHGLHVVAVDVAAVVALRSNVSLARSFDVPSLHGSQPHSSLS